MIADLLHLVFWAVAVLVTVPVVMLALECLAGSGRRRAVHYAGDPPPITVLMPAHDEAAGIAGPIRAVLAQLRSGDQLIVIADNCSDDTAAVARSMGASVIERHDDARRGKGYALEAAKPSIQDSPGRIVIVIDADCTAAPGALRHLALTSSRHHAVVQGADLLTTRADAPAIVRLSSAAFLIKNLVRQIGLQRLAGVALLQGTGMAFPLAVFRRFQARGESLVEDLELGVTLLVAGHRVIFDEHALFLSAAAPIEAAAGQRRRWEHGMMRSMARNVPMLIAAAVRRPRLFVVAMDQTIPPTAALVAIAVMLAVVIAGTGYWMPAALLLAGLMLLATSLALVWVRFRHRLGGEIKLKEVAGYMLWKLPLALQFITRRERRWVRTGREA